MNRLGVHASAAVTTGLQLPWGCAEIDPLGLATSFREKPVLPVHASVGLYILEPPALKTLLDLVDMSAEGAVEFENVLLPLLAEQRKLHAFAVPRDAWLPINTLKELETAGELLAQVEKAERWARRSRSGLGAQPLWLERKPVHRPPPGPRKRVWQPRAAKPLVFSERKSRLLRISSPSLH